MSFTEYVLWIVRMYAAAEMSMNSVERVGECKPSNSKLITKADELTGRPRPRGGRGGTLEGDRAACVLAL